MCKLYSSNANGTAYLEGTAYSDPMSYESTISFTNIAVAADGFYTVYCQMPEARSSSRPKIRRLVVKEVY